MQEGCIYIGDILMTIVVTAETEEQIRPWTLKKKKRTPFMKTAWQAVDQR